MANAKMRRIIQLKPKSTKTMHARKPDGQKFVKSVPDVGNPEKARNKLAKTACDNIAVAFNCRDIMMLRTAEKVLDGLLQIEDLLDVFRAAKGSIKGDDGVAKRLAISRYGVYGRLEMVGLNPDDFRSPTASIISLLMKSKFKSDVQKLLRYATKTPRPRQRPK